LTLIYAAGFLRVSSAGVDREEADTLRLVIRAGREDCGVNKTGGDENTSKKKMTFPNILPFIVKAGKYCNLACHATSCNAMVRASYYGREVMDSTSVRNSDFFLCSTLLTTE